MSSPYFKAMLTGDRYPEGRNLAENGSVRIDLSDTEDDPEAMMVILGLLYNTSNHVDAPAQIELSTLINITMLVDKYQWHELVTPHATHWFETIKPQIISKFSSLPSNMQIKVFVGDLGLRTRRSLQNSYMTMEHSLHTIDTSDPEVLLPTRVMKALNEHRIKTFQAVESVIYEFQALGNEYEENNSNILISYLLFGQATYWSKQLKLGQFSADYKGTSIQLLKDCIKDRSSGFSHNRYYSDYDTTIGQDTEHDLRYLLEQRMESLDTDNWGLDYDECKIPPSSPKEI